MSLCRLLATSSSETWHVLIALRLTKIEIVKTKNICRAQLWAYVRVHLSVACVFTLQPRNSDKHEKVNGSGKELPNARTQSKDCKHENKIRVGEFSTSRDSFLEV